MLQVLPECSSREEVQWLNRHARLALLPIEFQNVADIRLRSGSAVATVLGAGSLRGFTVRVNPPSQSVLLPRSSRPSSRVRKTGRTLRGSFSGRIWRDRGSARRGVDTLTSVG